MKEKKAAIAQIILKQGMKKDFLHYLDKHGEVIVKLTNASHCGAGIVYYILDRVKEKPEDVLKKLSTLNQELKQKVMSGLQQIRQEGMERGMERGIFATAKRMLKEGFHMDMIAKITGLSTSQLESLKR